MIKFFINWHKIYSKNFHRLVICSPLKLILLLEIVKSNLFLNILNNVKDQQMKWKKIFVHGMFGVAWEKKNKLHV
jgi:hypothetical protein